MKTVQDLARTILRDIEENRQINEQFLLGMKHGVLLLVERIVEDVDAGELPSGAAEAAQPEGDADVQGQRDPNQGA